MLSWSKFVHDFDDDGFGQGCKQDNQRQAVAELGREGLLIACISSPRSRLAVKPRLGRLKLAPALVVIIRMTLRKSASVCCCRSVACVHDLQEDVENVGVGFSISSRAIRNAAVC